jgi:hypothetical protein
LDKKVWDFLVKEHFNSKQKKFNCEFDNVISSELQKLGYRCWLRSKHNRILQNGEWKGKVDLVFFLFGAQLRVTSHKFAKLRKIKDTIEVQI